MNRFAQTAQIGYALAGAGLFAGFMQVFVFPPLQRRFRLAPFSTALISIWPFAYAVLPVLGALAHVGLRADGSLGDTAEAMVRVGVAVALGMSRVACMAFS